MRFGIGCSFYNDAKGLDRLLHSVAGQVALCIMIDGRYPSFGRGKGLAPLSTDGSREVCKQYDNTLLVDLPGTPQVAKRNAYLRLSKRYDLDFLIVMDSDEYIEKQGADWDTFRYVAEKRVNLDLQMYRIYNVYFTDENHWNDGWRPRLFYRPWEIRYDVKHYRLVIKAKNHLDRPVYEGESGRATIAGITMVHHRSIRTEDRNKDMDRYEDWLLQQESKSMRRKYRY
jgi:hypothetical protein